MSRNINKTVFRFSLLFKNWQVWVPVFSEFEEGFNETLQIFFYYFGIIDRRAVRPIIRLNEKIGKA